MQSPLGKYGPAAATIVGLSVVSAFIIGTLFRAALGLTESDLQSLRELALLCLGVILGVSGGLATASQEVQIANKRLDAIGAPSGLEVRNGHPTDDAQ